MRKMYTLLGCILLLQLSNKLSAQVLFSEDFSSATGTTPPAGWSNNEINVGDGEWAFDNPGVIPLSSLFTAPVAIFDSEYNGWGNDPEAALESPTFDASAVTDYIYLSFDHSFNNDNGDGSGYYAVEVWDGTDWNEIMYGYEDITEHVLVDITSVVNGASDAQVRFHWYGDYSYYWIIDNVTVEVVTCLPVMDVLADAITPTSIGISWTAQGSESNWNIEYGVNGFALGSGTPGTSSTESFTTSTPLTPNTTYDFYVQADCGAGDESPWVGPISFYTGYCDVTGLGADSDYFINNFYTTGGADANISNLTSGYSTDGYEDASSMTVSQFEGGPNVNFHADFGLSGYTYGIGVWVDWNDNMVFESSEQVFQSDSYQEFFDESFNVPAGTAVGSYRMRILADYLNSDPEDACTLDSGEGEVEDYTFVVLPIPTCLPVTDLEIDGETPTSIDISWTPGDSETAWNIEWGVPGFTPGTGTGEDSAQQTSSASFTIGGLDPNTPYDIYVQASCSSTDSSYWTLVSGLTLCVPITSLPWTENFDAMTQLDYNLFPSSCWLSENGDWYTDDINNNISYNSEPYSGDNFLGIRYFGDDYIWTPEFQLTAGRVYEFSFMWAGDNYNGWNGEAFVNSEQSSTGATSLGAEFVTMSDAENSDYRRAYYCFTPSTSGVYTFGLYVYSNYNPSNLSFDDFSLVERGTSAGTGGSLSACQISGLVDLNSVITVNDAYGIFTFDPNPNAIVNDSYFNPQYVPSGPVTVNYMTLGCLEDTVSATITIYPPSNAGIDGTITACKNEPIDLLSGLSGTVDLGGDWYNPSNVIMPSSQVITGTFPGQFNYDYITGNEVCPDDTSGVVVTVTSCNWLSVDENALESVNLYPNPSNGLVYIESTMSTQSFNLVITDVNGRVIETGSNSITNGVNTVNLSQVERGVYFFKLSNESAEKVIRVVIQ